MSFVYNDKAWQIVEYKNLYYIELYTRSIRVYNQSFDQILKRDNPQYYYAADFSCRRYIVRDGERYNIY